MVVEYLFISSKMSDQSLMTWLNSVSSWVMVMESWDLVKRKIVRSRDVVFLEDQLVHDNDKIEQASSTIKVLIRIDSFIPPIGHMNHRGELQEDDDVIENDDNPIVDEVEPIEQVDKKLPLYGQSLRIPKNLECL